MSMCIANATYVEKIKHLIISNRGMKYVLLLLVLHLVLLFLANDKGNYYW